MEGHVLLIYFLLMTPIMTHKMSKKMKCDEDLLIDPNENVNYTITTPGYPNVTYTPGTVYTWCVSIVEDITVSLLCDEFDIPTSADCGTCALIVSSKNKSSSYCGSKPFQLKFRSSVITINLYSSKQRRGGKFLCRIVPEVKRYNLRTIVYDNCDCGYSYRLRIVQGVETGINEFPYMAGLVDARRGAIIVCGATIISQKYVLTADHCLDALVLQKTGVVVGEHNIGTNIDTSVTRLIRARRFVPYPYYDSNTRQYDIALIELASLITYSVRVGPACLPFVSRNWDLTREYVTVLGWGTTYFGGPRSKFLQKANLGLSNIANCTKAYGDNVDAYTQLCTYGQDKDACQYDSGGPLLWFNSYINRYEIVGIVSYGRGCASGVPSVNTKVAPFLQWILDNTIYETYCYKNP